MAKRDVTQEAPESIATRVMGLVSVISASHSPKRTKEIESE